MKQLSIVIVNYNVRYFLELCLQSVQAAMAHIDAEIIVVDNNSQDDSCAMIKELFPEVHLIENTTNVGFAKANNQGIAIASGEYVCILNPDTVVTERVFEDLLKFSETKEKIGAVGVQLIDGTGKFLPESKRNLPMPKVAFQKVFGPGNSYYAKHIEKNQISKVEVLVGAFMFLKRSVYVEVGGFDEQYFMYGEDIDLSYTITKAGYTNYYFGEVSIVHFKGESTAKDVKYRKRFYGAMRIFYEKHLRRNMLESSLVRMGLWVATLSRKHNTPQLPCNPSGYAVLKGQDKVTQRLVSVVDKEVVAYDGVTSLPDNTELFLDLNTTSFQESITLLERHSNKNITFKFIPKNSTFAIGSNSCKGLGVLLHF